MKYFFLFIFYCGAVVASSQISISQKIVDYGTITADTPLEKEIFFINEAGSSSLLLTTDFPREYNAHISSKTVQAQDTIYLRWKFNPLQEGKFKDQIKLWFSSMDEPIILTIKGDVHFIDKYASPACPNFNERPAGMERTFLTDFKVFHKLTGEPISKAKITIVENGTVLAHIETNRNGEKTAKMPIRYYYFLVEREGFSPADIYSYVNSKNHRFVFELEPLVQEEQIAELIKVIPEEKEEKVVEEITIHTPDISKTISEEFSSQDYKPNNIVFLVDVSGSMNSNGRLDLLKSAMIELTVMMRPQDKISLISYARNANVLLPPTSGSQKEEIITQIKSLTSAGSTSGEKGLKKAYSTAKTAYIPKGNNRVYIATDGVFKVSENAAIEKLVKKGTKRKVYLSILGVKGTNFTNKKMEELAIEGKGSFTSLEDFETAGDQVKEMIKAQSSK